jgi:hypothetical protein
VIVHLVLGSLSLTPLLAPSPADAQATTVVVVRHAEKAATSHPTPTLIPIQGDKPVYAAATAAAIHATPRGPRYFSRTPVTSCGGWLASSNPSSLRSTVPETESPCTASFQLLITFVFDSLPFMVRVASE